MIVVSDATPLMSLMKAARLNILEGLYKEIIIPDAVYSELTSNARYSKEAEEIENSSFIRVVAVRERKAVEILRKVSGLDLGESEAIVYATDNNADILLMDENAGRRVAKTLGIKVRGTIGLILQAFDRGLLTASDVDESIAVLQTANRRISKELCQYAHDYVRK